MEISPILNLDNHIERMLKQNDITYNRARSTPQLTTKIAIFFILYLDFNKNYYERV